VGTTDERVVVASGGSREIGSAIAIRFAEAGATVARLGATTGELVDINGASYLRA
jgi:NAD(P)-dependent dehydrogenase (short-subunit alcohol dehydrogenase family)